MSPQTPYVSGPPGEYEPSPAYGHTQHVHQDFHTSPSPPPKRKRRTGLTIGLIALSAFVLLLCGGTVVALLGSGTPEATISDPPTGGPGVGTTIPARPTTQPTTPGAAAPAPATTIKDGTWTAGTDFPVGRYEVTSQADLCAWQVYTGEQPDVQYVDPGHVGPGHYAFTFKVGQHLMTQGCGTWRKTG